MNRFRTLALTAASAAADGRKPSGLRNLPSTGGNRGMGCRSIRSY